MWQGKEVPCASYNGGAYDGNGCYWVRWNPQPPLDSPDWGSKRKPNEAFYSQYCIGSDGSLISMKERAYG